MKGDFSRRTFDRSKHYSGVEMQQGRVQVDADWNEQADIARHRAETESIDVVGPSGAPMFDAAFGLVDKNGVAITTAASLADVYLTAGRYYVDGKLCENDAIVALLGQPDAPQTAPANGRYMAYVDVWERHITTLDDPSIREVALGGPDTATRRRTVWQVKLAPTGQPNDSCLTPFTGTPSTGLLTASLAPAPANADDCIVPQSVDYRSLENQLYRVEIHKPGPVGTATFKWSRENGSIVTLVQSIDPNNTKRITVADLGRDDVLGFHANDWVEITDETTDLAGARGTLYQIDGAPDAVSRTITLKTAPAVDFTRKPKLRRWDQQTVTAQGDVLTKATNTALEFGVQVAFSPNSGAQYNTGDNWLVPARTSNGDPRSGRLEWPADSANAPLALPAIGIHHHYARVATIEWSAAQTKWVLTDCRNLFPPITELTSFYYLGGDGQEGEFDPNNPNTLVALPAPLQVGVANGSWPIAGARVRFKVVPPSAGVLVHASVNSTLVNPASDGTAQVDVYTADGTAGSNKGVAAIVFKMDGQLGADHQPLHPLQQVVATLLDANGNPVQLPITFSATYERNSAVLSYAGGDGQEAHRGRCLPAPLRVLVSDDFGIITGKKVQFTIKSTNPKQFTNETGVLTPTFTNTGGAATQVVTTNANGIAECYWAPSANATAYPSQEWVAATLVDGPADSAIDFFCHDLSFHNRHLHGSGIVCGLQVYCGPNADGSTRNSVTVQNGYAIDSFGKDIIVRADGAAGDTIDIMEMVKKAGLLSDATGASKPGSGSVSLMLRPGRTPGDRYSIEAYDATATSWGHAFDGTFWKDIYNDCITPLMSQIGLGTSGKREYGVAVLNLTSSTLYPRYGGHVLISTREDALLRELYEKLKANISSKTFCDLKNPNRYRPLPTYPQIYQTPDATVRPATIFGTKVRQRLRVDPTGKYALAMGNDDVVQVFDVSKETLIGDFAFPTAGVVVNDVAFSKDGSECYVFGVTSANATLVATAKLGGSPVTFAWSGAARSLLNVGIVRVEYSAAVDKYFGTAPGSGLYEIGPAEGKASQFVQFAALGHFTIGSGAVGVATVNDGSGRYSEALAIDLRGKKTSSIKLNAVGTDDIVLADVASGPSILFAVVNPVGGQQRSKQLNVYTMDSLSASFFQSVDLEWSPPPNDTSSVDTGAYRLVYSAATRMLLISSSEAFVLKRYDVARHPKTLEGKAGTEPGGGVVPVQLAPVALAADQTGQVLALNSVSTTVTKVPVDYVSGKTFVILSALAQYHSDMLAAFTDLFEALAQAIKDCVCDHLLVKCTEPKETPLYLARIDIREGELYNICNFSRRKYVHTFPAVEYWLSVVPIIPIISKIVGDACCRPLVGLFSSKSAGDATTPATGANAVVKNDVIPIDSAMKAMAFANDFSATTTLKPQITDRVKLFGSIAKGLVAQQSDPITTIPTPPAAEAVHVNTLIGQPAQLATATLATSGVRVASTEQLAVGAQTRDMLFAPTTLPTKGAVTLVLDAQQNVVGYRMATEVAQPVVVASAASATDATVPVATLNAELAKRDAQIAQLTQSINALTTNQTQALQTRDTQITELSRRLDIISKTPPTK